MYLHIAITSPDTEYAQLFQYEGWNWVKPTDEIRSGNALVFAFLSPTPLSEWEIQNMTQVPDVQQLCANIPQLQAATA